MESAFIFRCFLQYIFVENALNFFYSNFVAKKLFNCVYSVNKSRSKINLNINSCCPFNCHFFKHLATFYNRKIKTGEVAKNRWFFSN